MDKELLKLKYKDRTLWTPQLGDEDYDFKNEKGNCFWLDLRSSEWAWRENSNGVTLPSVYVWFIVTPEGLRTRYLFDYKTGHEFESSSLEGIGSHIDMLKVLEIYPNS